MFSFIFGKRTAQKKTTISNPLLNDIRLLLVYGDNLEDEVICAIITMARNHYLRFRPYTVNWDTNARARSWILEYALAHCKLTIGEYPRPISSGIMVNSALAMIALLEAELQKYS